MIATLSAEARARREELAVEGELDETEDGGVEESPAPERARRRTNGARRRAS